MILDNHPIRQEKNLWIQAVINGLPKMRVYVIKINQAGDGPALYFSMEEKNGSGM